jgi:hypothetical protein
MEHAKTAYDVGRQRELDALQRPIMERNRRVAEQQIAQADAPLKLAAFAPDQHALLHLMWDKSLDDKTAGPEGVMKKIAEGEQARREPVLGEKIAAALGGSWDVNPESPSYGSVVRPDGSEVTMEEGNRMGGVIQGLITANTGLDHAVEMKIKRLKADLNKGLIGEPEYDARMAKINEFKNNPNAQLKVLRDQLAKLSSLTSTTNPILMGDLSVNIPRIEAKIAKLETSVAKQKKQYALKSGEKLVDEEGNVTYSMPQDTEKKKTITVSPGQVVIDADGKVIFEAKDKPALLLMRMARLYSKQKISLPLEKVKRKRG